MSLKGCLKIPILSWHAKPMQIICDQWSSADVLVQYEDKHTHTQYTHRGLHISLYRISKTKALRIQGFCCSPKSTLTHSSFFCGQAHLKNMFTAVLTRLCLHSNCCPPIRFRHLNICLSHSLEKSTDGVDSGFLPWLDGPALTWACVVL